MMHLRLAVEKDADALFAWRNDPETLAASRSTAPVPRKDHDNWMKLNVLIGYPEHRVLIASNDTHGTVGVIRFDAVKGDVMKFEVSITLAPRFRGMGLASDVLNTACTFMEEYSILAEVRQENTASRRLFERCGFEEKISRRTDGFVNYVKEPTV